MKFNTRKIHIKPNKRKLLSSLASAFFLIIANYFVNNASLFTGESITQYFWFQKACNLLNIKGPVDYGDAVYFNISYDKQFVPAYEGDYEGGSLYGNNIITDRKKLYEFLKLLKETNTYKYVILDIAFDDVRDKTEYDDSLFNTIKSMRDIVFADISDIKLSRSDIYDKRAKAFYYYTPIETNFARYQYTFNDSASIATHVFNAIEPEWQIKKHGFYPLNIYTSNGNLCFNSLFLTFDDNSAYTGRYSNGADFTLYELNEVYNLGQFLREKNDDLINQVNYKCNNKFVVVCNTETDDIHDNYVGLHIPGAQIIMRALTSLLERKHIVSFWNTVYWFIIFFSICLLSVRNRPILSPIINRFPLFNRLKNFWLFFLSFISYSTFLLIFSFYEYVLWDRVTSIMLPIIYFSLLNLYIKFKQQAEYL